MSVWGKLATSMLVVAGGAGLYSMQAQAEQGNDSASETDVPESAAPDTPEDQDHPHLPGDADEWREMEHDIIEQALRQYANPLQQLKSDREQLEQEEYLTYVVKEGETLSEIAVAHGISVREIAEHNGLHNPDRISIGQELDIRIKAKPYSVRFGESLETIAEQQGVELEDLLANNENLHEASRLFPGQEIMLPTREPEPVHQPLSPQRGSVQIAGTQQADNHTVSEQSANADVQDISFSWPLKGQISSPFGIRWGRMHNGIDITHPDARSPIQAAMSGVVTDAYHHRGGYGNLIIIDHGGGYETYYAHLSEIHVSTGQTVNQGDTLGLMGSTGNATGNHLHFEIRVDHQPQNPLNFLP